MTDTPLTFSEYWICEACGQVLYTPTTGRADGASCLRCADAAVVIGEIKPTKWRAIPKVDTPRSPPEEAKALLDEIVQAVAELPDCTSPDDWPEALLVTVNELRQIIEPWFRALLAEREGASPQTAGDGVTAVEQERDQLRKDGDRLLARAVMAEHHKSLSLLGRSSEQEAREMRLREELAECQIERDALRRQVDALTNTD